jgi:hypothetical protein
MDFIKYLSIHLFNGHCTPNVSGCQGLVARLVKYSVFKWSGDSAVEISFFWQNWVCSVQDKFVGYNLKCSIAPLYGTIYLQPIILLYSVGMLVFFLRTKFQTPGSNSSFAIAIKPWARGNVRTAVIHFVTLHPTEDYLSNKLHILRKSVNIHHFGP